jgi:hypothetical protein
METGSDEFVKSDTSLDTETESTSSSTVTTKYVLGPFCFCNLYQVFQVLSKPNVNVIVWLIRTIVGYLSP